MSRLLEEKLDWLWKAYRAACRVPEPTTNFMPEMWSKIEARRGPSWLAPLRGWATRVAAAAGVAAALLAVSVGMWQQPSSTEILEVGYVDSLAQDADEEFDGDLWLLIGNSE